MAYPDDLPDEELNLLNITREDPEEAARLKREQDLRVEVRRDYLRGLMQQQPFREWLMEQLVGLGTFEQAFGAGPTGFPDPLATQYAMGMKAAGWNLWLMFDDVAPDLASLMRREASPRGR